MSNTQIPTQMMEQVMRLSQGQLRALNALIVERLKIYHKAQAINALREFKLLDRVAFDDHGKRQKGTISRINQKSVSVLADDGVRWTISPHLLRKINDPNSMKSALEEIMKG